MIKFFLVLIVLGWLTVSTLVRPGYFPMHDDAQALRVLEMRKCLDDGQIPCRWVPDMGFGYGYPQFNYYPPLPYYFMAGITYFKIGYLDSVKIGFIFASLMAGLGMWLLSRKYWGEAGGLISGLFYFYLPYRANNLYVRGAMGELWAMAWLPWIFYWFDRLLEKREWRNVVWLAIGLFGIATTHMLSLVMILPFLLVWAGFKIYQKKGNDIKNTLMGIIYSGLLSIGLASFYVLPVIFERDLVHFETLTMGYFNFLAHFVGVKQLLFSTYWGYGASNLGPIDGMSLSIGLLHWTVPLISLLIGLISRRKFASRISALMVLIFFMWGYLFLIHPKATFLWQNLPLLENLQFPWRFLSVSGFLGSWAAGSIMFWNKNISNRFLLVLIIPLILFNASFFRPSEWLNISDEQHFAAWNRLRTISIFDYLPKSAEFPPPSPALDKPTVILGEGNLINYKQGSDWWSGNVEIKEAGEFQVPIFSFPDMKVFVDGQQIDYLNGGELGLVTFKISKGRHHFEVKLYDTPIRRFGNVVSLISLLLIISLSFKTIRSRLSYS